MDAKIGVDTAENEPSKVRGFLMGVGGVIIAQHRTTGRGVSVGKWVVGWRRGM